MYLLNFPSCLHLFFPNRRNAVHCSERSVRAFRNDIGDPWEEFNRIVWSAQVSPSFASGMIDGYFDHKVPDLFWKLLAIYIINNIVGALPWAVPYGAEEIAVMQQQAKEILEWYDDMNQIIPSWYLNKKKTE